MSVNRQIDEKGIIITYCDGTITVEDAMNSLDELDRLTSDSDTIFEIITFSKSVYMDLTHGNISHIEEKTKSLFKRFRLGRVAFVGETDHVFGTCRQLEMMLHYSNVEVSVFRTRQQAAQWIDEIRKA